MKRRLKIGALLCAFAALFSVTGCADTSWAIKSGEASIPSGVYLYYLLNNASSVQSNAGAGSSSLTASGSADPWAQTIEGTGAVQWAINQALDSCKNLLVVEKQSAQRKVTLTDTQKSTAKSYAESSYTSYKDIFSKNGITQASLERVFQDYYLNQALFDSYYGEKGDKAVAQTELEKYYTDNFVHVKQIFVSKIDTTTYAALSDDKLKEQKKKADEAYAAASKDPAKFQTYVDKYNEDPGMKQTPDGYIFSKATAQSQSFDQKFVDLAFSLKDSQVGMAESNMGYFIEYKVATDPKASTFDANMKESVLSEMKGADFQTVLKDLTSKETFSQNDKTINKYSPKKLKLS